MPEPGEQQSIRVLCRVRPLNESEERAGSKFTLKFPSPESLSIANKVFVYDQVFKPSISQEEVYNCVAKPVVGDVLNGYNGTIFAYGQTSSGKTHTMEGVLGNDKMQGIIPRIVGDIFQYIYQMDENLEFHIKVSYFEIYMDKIKDLLDVTKTNLAVHEDKNRIPYVKGATERFVSSPEEVFEAIDEGKSNRHVAVTNMNEHSSRSHSVFLIHVKQENVESHKKLSGKLYLVDLAGSEKVSKTGAEGSVLDEAKNINKSLSALGNVIAALADDNKSHIPYRDSKLTRILQESLGGNARTSIVICCSPASYNESETKSTLMFGQRAKTVKNVVTVNEELTAEEWKRRWEKEKERATRYRAKLERAEAELERWRMGEKVPSEEQTNLKEVLVEPLKESSSSHSSTNLTSMPSASSLSSVQASSQPLTSDEKRHYEIQQAELYKQLDEKDDEINALAQDAEGMKVQLGELEDVLSLCRRENDTLQSEMTRMQAESTSTKEEVKQVVDALEELALNYDQKAQEAELRGKEIDSLGEELSTKLRELKAAESELQSLRSGNMHQKKRLIEMMLSIIRDLGEIGTVLDSTELTKPTIGNDVEEDFTFVRLYIAKLKSEVKTLCQTEGALKAANADSASRLEEIEKKLSHFELLKQQHEAKITGLSENLHEIDVIKRRLEETIDVMTEENAKLRAQEKLLLSKQAESGTAQAADSAGMTKAFEEEMEQHRLSHQQQLTALRDELDTKQGTIAELKDANKKLSLENEKVLSDFARLKSEESGKSSRLAELSLQMDRREQARQDLKGLEETVGKELQTLHNLRKLFVQDLQARVKKTSGGAASAAGGKEVDDGGEEELGGSAAQKQKIQFLESNLDQLTKVHKQLVRDNAELRCELPKLEKRLRSTADRVKSLESALKEAKEGAMKDRKRYQTEVDRIKEAVRQRNLQRRGQHATVVKTIRAGQAGQAAGAGPVGIRGGGAPKGDQ